MHLPIEDAVVLIHAAMFGVGRFAAGLLAFANSSSLMDKLTLSTNDLAHLRSQEWRLPQGPCDLYYLACAWEAYRWGHKHLLHDVHKQLFVDATEQEAEYLAALQPWLYDDANVDEVWFKAVWPLVHFSFVAGRRGNIYIHDQEWK